MAVPLRTPEAIASAPFRASGSNASFLPLFVLEALGDLLRVLRRGVLLLLRRRGLRLLLLLLLRSFFFSFLRRLRLPLRCFERERFGDLEREREREVALDSFSFSCGSCFTFASFDRFGSAAGDGSRDAFLSLLRDFERDFSRLAFFSLRFDFERDRFFFLSTERERFLCFLLLRAFERDFERDREALESDLADLSTSSFSPASGCTGQGSCRQQSSPEQYGI